MRSSLTILHFRLYLKQILAVSFLIIATLLPLTADGAERGLANVTAAFIYKISKFVIWPDSTFDTKESTINLCLYGPDKLGLAAILGKLKGKKTQQRFLNVFSIATEQALADSLKGGKHCHILYFTNGNISRVLKGNSEELMNTLLMGSNKSFLNAGGMVALILIGKKLNIYINRQALERSQVKLQARLLMITKTL